LSTGIITTVVGNGNFDNRGDHGPASAAAIHNAFMVGLDGSGDVLLPDTRDNVVRVVSGGALPIIVTAGIPINWTGAGDGMNWTDASNWSTHTVPNPANDVTINTGVATTINLTGGVQNIHSLTVGSNPALSVSGGSLTVRNTSQLAGGLNVN